MIIDTARLGTARPAPGGGVVVPARIGRSGVQVYRRPDGSVVRAYRPAEEVRVADYTGAPVTVGHPDGGVTPESWRQHSVGVVREQGPQTERIGAHEFVSAGLQINDGAAIARLGTDLLECSCAYTATKVWEQGVTDSGEEYDVIFKGLIPNHVALGPAGFARAGREARLVADGEDEMADQLFDNTLIADGGESALKTTAQPPAPSDRDQMIADAALLRDANAHLVKELETVRGTLAAAEAKRDELQATVDGLPQAIADGVVAELKFRESLKGRLPADFDFNGKSPREIKLAAIKHANPKAVIADSVSDAWLDGFLEATPAPVEHDHNTTHGPGTPVQDSREESIYAKRSREAFAVKGIN